MQWSGDGTKHYMNKTFFILGPIVDWDSGVLEAVYALNYLPDNYRLIVPVRHDPTGILRQEIEAAVRENSLEERVQFIAIPDTAASPEAFASAALALTRGM
jgi:acetylornithine deacetylase/succinyl-diaminopimelate desuccinylase-like protein